MPRPSQRLICLVSPGHLAATPRLVKEANALLGVGYRVHTVTLDHFPANRARDDEVLENAPWTATRIQPAGGAFGLTRRLLQRGAQLLPAQWLARLDPLTARAKEREIGQLTRAAGQTAADYYIGHCLAGLPVVAAAARQRAVRFGFDLEDFHEAETTEIERDPKQLAIARSLLRRHLPKAAHLTAASPLIAAAYKRDYGVEPAVVLNVFPRSYAPPEQIDPGPVSLQRPAVLYWVSQTIGPGRGLEKFVTALAHVQTPTELHLRGHVASGFSNEITRHAQQVGYRHAIRWLPFSPASEFVRLAAAADLGLSVEESSPRNRAVCLTNKVFTYLLAGIPQILSSTPAQEALAPELGIAAILGDLQRPAEVAASLDAFFSDSERLKAARGHAWYLAHTRYCWDMEKEKFLSSVARALA